MLTALERLAVEDLLRREEAMESTDAVVRAVVWAVVASSSELLESLSSGSASTIFFDVSRLSRVHGLLIRVLQCIKWALLAAIQARRMRWSITTARDCVAVVTSIATARLSLWIGGRLCETVTGALSV